MGAGHWKKRKQRAVSWLAEATLITSLPPYKEVPVGLPMWPGADPGWPSSSLLHGSYRSDLLMRVSRGSSWVPEGEMCFRKPWNNEKLFTMDLKSIWWGNSTQNRNIPGRPRDRSNTPHCCFCHCTCFPVLTTCLHWNPHPDSGLNPVLLDSLSITKPKLHLWAASLCQVLYICSFNPPINPLRSIWLLPFYRCSAPKLQSDLNLSVRFKDGLLLLCGYKTCSCQGRAGKSSKCIQWKDRDPTISEALGSLSNRTFCNNRLVLYLCCLKW